MQGHIGGEAVLGLTLISVAVGLVLALAYHLSAARFQTWASRVNTAAAPLITVLGFIIRLGIVGGILAALGVATSLNMLAVCLAFVGLFTILSIWSVYHLMSRQHRNTPPTPGTPAA